MTFLSYYTNKLLLYIQYAIKEEGKNKYTNLKYITNAAAVEQRAVKQQSSYERWTQQDTLHMQYVVKSEVN